MRLSLFLLLVALTCIACNSIVASSKDLIQVKTLDTNSQRERMDEIHRKLREGTDEADFADVEERMAFNVQWMGADSKGLMSKVQNALKWSNEKINSYVKIMKRLYQSFLSKFKKKKPLAEFPRPARPKGTTP
ncbi:hypothetical protein KXD40_007460 [Peronospora effusa]|uniref:RxLR effector protein n=1 Tax=Peronospora effusa TaxID=542832 RepID=A0A3M6V9F6_9STRA|nr:hypothetical protein DD238_006569 [Peronospora effusa]RQM12018.1 hypothetical protein DD237_006952 [Peronospora effusa]UIZ29081.1 hypothetical protein KXD40_007460 [Peronospora effusa]